MWKVENKSILIIIDFKFKLIQYIVEGKKERKEKQT